MGSDELPLPQSRVEKTNSSKHFIFAEMVRDKVIIKVTVRVGVKRDFFFNEKVLSVFNAEERNYSKEGSGI